MRRAPGSQRKLDQKISPEETSTRRELDKAEELEIEEKLLQRKTETFRKLQIPIMINYDYDKFAASKKEQATTMALHLDLLYTCCL